MAIRGNRSHQRGIVIVKDGQVADQLPLEVGGIMTVAKAENRNGETQRHGRDCPFRWSQTDSDEDPFLSLEFLSLPVIPSLKLTDRGLFDVEKFAFVSVEARKKAGNHEFHSFLPMHPCGAVYPAESSFSPVRPAEKKAFWKFVSITKR